MWSTVVVILFLVFGGHGKAVFKDSGLDEVLVVIDDENKEADLGSITSSDLTAFFHEASKALYVATKGRTYFRNIEFLIPQSWLKKPEFQVAGKQTLKNADILIGEPNPAYGDQPYVIQPGQCGDPGHLIHLSPNFLKDGLASLKDETKTRVVAKTLVQQWVKYRYGVFDESVAYPSSAEELHKATYRSFYADGDDKNITYHPSVCGALTGHSALDDGSPCQFEEASHWIHHRCRFIPDEKQSINSSLMYSAHLEDVVEFCEDNGPNAHNILALNEQNSKCEYRSIWSVLLQHADFEGFDAKHADISQVPAPTITFYQRPSLQRIIYVLDRSSSMKDCNAFDAMIQATKVSIASLSLPVDVGVVEFSSKTTEALKLNMTVLQTPADVKLALESLPTSTYGMTCIKCGAHKAVQALRANDKETRGAIMVLLTDGNEEGVAQADTILPYIQNLTDAGVVVNTIAVGKNASQDLTKVAVQTGGKALTISGLCGVEEDWEITFVENTKAQNVRVNYKKILIPTEVQHTEKGAFTIEPDLGIRARIIFAFNASNSGIDITIKSPTGVQLTISHLDPHFLGVKQYQDKNIAGLTVTLQNGLVILIFESMEAGTWTYTITKTLESVGSASNGVLVISSEPRYGRAIDLQAYVSQFPLDLRRSDRLIIYASLFNGSQPVSGSVAAAYRLGNELRHFELRDDGLGADSNANDGIYSGFFSDFEKSEEEIRYSIQIVAEVPDSNNPSVFIRRYTQVSVSIINGGNPPPQPPSQVKDLAITSVDANTQEATFLWTAPGGVRDQGAATSYEIAVSNNLHDLIPKVLDSAQRLDASKITPQTIGASEKFVFVIEALTSGAVYARIRTINAAGVKGSWSNVVRSPPPNLPPTAPVPDSNTTTEATTTNAETTTEGTTTVAQPPASVLHLDSTLAITTIYTPHSDLSIFLKPPFIQYGKLHYRFKVEEIISRIADPDCSSPSPSGLTSELLNPDLKSRIEYVEYKIPVEDYIKLVQYEKCTHETPH